MSCKILYNGELIEENLIADLYKQSVYLGVGWVNDILPNESYSVQKEYLNSISTELYSYREQVYKNEISNNYINTVKFLEQELVKTKAKLEIYKNKRKSKTENTVKNDENIKFYENKEQQIQNYLNSLQENKVENLFDVVKYLIDDIYNVLNSDNLHDIYDLKSNINFLKSFDLKEEYEDFNFNEYIGKIAKLVGSEKSEGDYDFLIKNKLKKYLEDNDVVNSILENLNSNEELKNKFKEELGENFTGFTLEHLLFANKDLSAWDENFLGVQESNTGDTILPQFLLEEFLIIKHKEENKILDLVEELKVLRKRHPDIDLKELIDGDNLINIYTPLFFSKLKTRNLLISSYFKSDKQTESYKDIFYWYKNNTEVINFLRLKEVKDQFYSNPRYKKYFQNDSNVDLYTEEQMQIYSDNLKKRLGNEYDTYVFQILNQLEKIDLLLEEADTNPSKQYEAIRKNQWDFIQKYLKNDFSSILKYNKISYFSDFYNIVFVPKYETADKIKTGYYSENYQKVIANPVLAEFLNVYKKMGKYIANVYEYENSDKISIPKIKTSYSEKILNSFDNIKNFSFNKTKILITDVFKAWKDMFYEKNTTTNSTEVRSNDLDISEQEIIENAKTYMLKGMLYKDAYNLAKKEILATYNISDLDRNFVAALVTASIHSTRLQIEPLTDLVFNTYKTTTNLKGEKIERKKGIERFENFINRTVLNNKNGEKGSNSMFDKELTKNKTLYKLYKKLSNTSLGEKIGLNENNLKSFTDQELVILKNLEDLKYNRDSPINNFKDTIKDINYYFDSAENIYKILNENNEIVQVTKEKFEIELDKYIDDKIDSLGLNLSIGGVIDGILKSFVLRYMSLSPVGGMFNRIEGKNTNMIEDIRGEFWTTGNNAIAEDFLSWTNLSNTALFRKFGNTNTEKYKQVLIFRNIMDRFGSVQNKANDLQKNTENDVVKNIETVLFDWAVNLPEFKTQGTVALNILMDTDIADNEGKIHPFFNKETQTFSAFDLDENGKLILKENFNSLNFSDEYIGDIRNKIQTTIAKIQGNYLTEDRIKIKNSVIGRALTQFKNWFPSHWERRWGNSVTENELNINFSTRKLKNKGRYLNVLEKSPGVKIVHTLSQLGIAYGLLGFLGFAGLSVFGLSILGYFVYKYKNTIKTDSKTILDTVEFLKEVVISTLHYPIQLSSSIPFIKNVLKNKDQKEWLTTFKNKKHLSSQDIGDIKSLAKELAIQLNFLLLKIALGVLLWDKEDDEDSNKRQFFNFVQNQLSRVISTLQVYEQPEALYEDQSRIGFLKTLTDIQDIVKYTIIDPDFNNFNKSLINLTPIPSSVLKGHTEGVDFFKLPFYQSYLSDENLFINKRGSYKWVQEVIKNVNTNGEYMAEKEIRELKKELKKEVKKDILKITNNKEVIETVYSNTVEEIFGKRENNQSYKEFLNSLENKQPKEQEKLLESLKEKLLNHVEKGEITNEEMLKILEIRFL